MTRGMYNKDCWEIAQRYFIVEEGVRSPPVDWQINQRERSAIRERDRMRVGFAKEFAIVQAAVKI